MSATSSGDLSGTSTPSRRAVLRVALLTGAVGAAAAAGGCAEPESRQSAAPGVVGAAPLHGPDLPADYGRAAALSVGSAGRILVMDSLSFLSLRTDLPGIESLRSEDVVVGCSFAGLQTFAQPLALGPRGLIAHEAGVGRDNAGIAGLAVAQNVGVPAAACETMSARLADGRSLYEEGRIHHANEAAAALGVELGMPVREAATRLLKAPPGRPQSIPTASGSHTEGEIRLMERGGDGGVYATWFIALVKGHRPNDVFVTATHCGTTMAEYARDVRPKGIIANDAGVCKDRSGIIALDMLEAVGIPAAAVSAASARIGDPNSTYSDGVISFANPAALAKQVTIGMPAQLASRRMLTG